jgi:hypothetical protein
MIGQTISHYRIIEKTWRGRDGRRLEGRRHTAPDQRLEQIADLYKIKRFPDQFSASSWTGLGPGEVIVLPRDNSTQEIHAFDLQLP